MGKRFQDLLADWPRNTIRDDDVAEMLGGSDDARYAKVKRALAAGHLIQLRRGLYLIASKSKQILPDEFEMALQIYEPSFVSMESALSCHNWIPEAVYTTTSVTPRRAQEFKNKFGYFTYGHVPATEFYLGVRRRPTRTGVLIIAEPWRALADYIYVRRRCSWNSLAQLEQDLRIDVYTALESDVELLAQLCERYPSPRVRKVLSIFLKEILESRG